MRRRTIAALLSGLLMSSAASADWHRATSDHFVVYSDDQLDDVRQYTTQLEQFDQGIRAWHLAPQDKRGASARVTVFVLDSTSDVGKLSGRQGVAGFYKPIAGESVAFTPRSGTGDLGARAILFHEYTHHWMLTNWTDAALPPWFVEGFAELHATALFRGDQIIFGAVPAYRRYSVGQMNALPMNRLLRFDLGSLTGLERDALYSHGWALTHYLTFDEEGRKRLAAYIGALNSGKELGDPAALIGGGVDMDLRLNRYVRQRRLPSAAIGLSKLPTGQIKVEKLSAAESAMMPALIASKRGVDKDSASGVLALARRLAAPYPKDPAVLNELAEAEYDSCAVADKPDASCFAGAANTARQAVAADAASVHALVYSGMAETAALKAQKVRDEARWTAARQWFLKANKLAPEMPQPLIGYYRSFEQAGETPTDNARAALLYAYALAPYDSDVRLRAAKVYLDQGKFDEARTAIAPVAYNVESPRRAEFAKKVLAAIDARDAKAAAAEIENAPESDDD